MDKCTSTNVCPYVCVAADCVVAVTSVCLSVVSPDVQLCASLPVLHCPLRRLVKVSCQSQRGVGISRETGGWPITEGRTLTLQIKYGWWHIPRRTE
jgi:hypothetical protein